MQYHPYFCQTLIQDWGTLVGGKLYPNHRDSTQRSSPSSRTLEELFLTSLVSRLVFLNRTRQVSR